MKLSIIRHAQAVDFGAIAFGGDRELTKKGIEQSQRLGEHFTESGLLPDIVLSSPVLRARQTAEILCQSAGLSEPLLVPFLRCGMRPEDALSELKGYVSFDHIALVGHQPDLSYLLTRLMGCHELPFRVKKASLSVLEGDLINAEWKLLEHTKL